jgi:hypothetical protein
MSGDLVPQLRDTQGLSLNVEPTEPPADAALAGGCNPPRGDRLACMVAMAARGIPGLALARLAVHERGPIPSLDPFVSR